MKKRIGICFFIGTLCAVVVAQGALLFAHEYNKRQENAEMSAEKEAIDGGGIVASEEAEIGEKELLTPSMNLMENEKFYLQVQDGYVTVYQGEDGDIFCETNIRFSLLPEEIREKIMTGLSFSKEKDLYDFLESYSS